MPWSPILTGSSPPACSGVHGCSARARTARCLCPIITDQTRKLVYVVGTDGKVAPRPVVTGPPVEGLRVVREGLAPTDRVVINGLTRLQPGMPVKATMTVLKPRAANTAPVSAPLSAPPAAEAQAK